MFTYNTIFTAFDETLSEEENIHKLNVLKGVLIRSNYIVKTVTIVAEGLATRKGFATEHERGRDGYVMLINTKPCGEMEVEGVLVENVTDNKEYDLLKVTIPETNKEYLMYSVK